MTEVGIQTDSEPLLPPPAADRAAAAATAAAEKAGRPMSRTRCLRLLLLLTAAASTLAIVYFAYLCPAGACGGGTGLGLGAGGPPGAPLADRQGRPRLPSAADSLSFDQLLSEGVRFDVSGDDVMVFLHIQKTGGTEFGRHLVHDLDLERPCVCYRRKKRCQCLRPGRDSRWLFSRYSTGWRCGLHADWTELTACVDEAMDQLERDRHKRRYFYISLLREPVQRYLSEWKHVRRGATWSTSRHWCGGRDATEAELPHCYDGEDWYGVSLNEFLRCDSNLAANRQTRMLADLHLVNCYTGTGMSADERDRVMLASAKTNLRQMAFFGLTEDQPRSQYMFEQLFGLRFQTAFAAYNRTHAESALRALRPGQLEEVRRRNALDLELYEYARQLLQERFERIRAADDHFREHMDALGTVDERGSTELEHQRR
ncbi:heparan-sulfate 6-O-sulfotransferase 3-B-like [Amphibalanus amphitrite]|uniref:heparan-sulfate 6-O-sulfotransferase 3-B-like n=1 Tax=Amphibalanus amphitrite TaxID=1232801 RepID=UPI001C92AF6D|nr:heparan-sulfate 6-O-sulfotransferase 3-B-like [Amphibalanus amphitrite]XP_043205626.1 heparan-sulfate 6-O-sulfotransferase 3-B-like [Amphibalanus amphitrite]